MSPVGIGSIVFVCIFGSAMLGRYLRTVLPDHHLTDDPMRVVTLSTGLIATLVVMVLGLLISSAKTFFESINEEATQNASKVVLPDRALVNYGPEAKETRERLHHIRWARCTRAQQLNRLGDFVRLRAVGLRRGLSDRSVGSSARWVDAGLQCSVAQRARPA